MASPSRTTHLPHRCSWPGKQWSRRVDKPGSYEYVCTVHAYMTGVVVVKPEPARQL
ncbi:cupredoxin domain-containing protein [Variovorax rhizosphaerae]|uniref:Plastocyanin/azurin family copper-binding protein n=1 Tax=Variovorax rhizosphaerae TaxID=1836200 RepID=A0ABU8WM40_9BURK